MAPPPEYDKEPKAPDKSATNISCDETKALHNLVNDQQTNSDNKSSSTTASADVENNKLVETLDDGQLRALLDEAITYKCPKDREGKSSLFKELLEEVEQDEQASEAAARSVGRSVNRAHAVTSGRGNRSRRALPHSNSLQDLVAALAAEPAPRRHHRAPPAPAPAPVSARAIHGGSLPSGVDTSFLLGEEPARGAGYLATVRCVNPPPLAERRVSTDASCNELDSLNRRSKPAFPMTYTARATLEIGSGAVSSGRAVTTTTASNQVDSAIPFSCITTPEVVASCNTTSSTQQSTVAVDPKPLQLASSYRAVASLVGDPAPAPATAPAPAPRAATPPLDTLASLAPRHHPANAAQSRGVISSSFNGLPLSRPNYGSTGNTSHDEYKKPIDENGNSVQAFNSPLSGSSQHKKPRRKKSSKNETVIKSHQIDGYQGNKDLNEVLRFIESAADTTRAGKLGRAKHRDDADDKGGKKRSGTRKDKESKMKRATSMEELSLSRMEDLTDKPSPPARQPRHSDQAKAERRSWGDDARDATTRFFREEPIDVPVVPDTEFQTVTKKRKPRRRADEAPETQEPAGGDPPRARPPEPRARRVSAPPSDRSNDSNDDMDSVHSLPADAVVGRAPISYADIARTRNNIPDLIESCNFYSEPERDRSEKEQSVPVTDTPVAPLPTPGDVDAYPALEPRGRRAPPATKPQQTPEPKRDLKVERTEPIATTVCTVSCCMAPEWSAPDVVADRRPAVILLDSCARPRDMDGVTFGFDINETLLGDGGPARRPRCDLIRDALEGVAPPDSNGVLTSAPPPPPPAAPAVGGLGVAVGGACGALRYVPPAPPSNMVHLHQIIDYVGAAWDDVMRLGAGKVRYYTE